MRITRRGGLAGVPVSAEVETRSVADDAGAHLEALVRAHAGKPPRDAVPPHPDAFVYEITVPDQSQPVFLPESEIPIDVRRVIRDALAKGSVGSRHPPTTAEPLG